VKKIAGKLVFALLVLFIVIPVAFPLIWILLSSFKTQVDITASPPRWLFEPTLQNYEKVFREQDFLKFFINSTIVGVSATLVSLALGLPAAWSIARFKQTKLNLLILVARIMPGIALLLPWFLIFSRLGLIDSYAALVMAHVIIGLPLVVWIMSSFFEQVPLEIEESARVDGATRQRTFLEIVLPISSPGVVTATTLSFLFSWNNFMFSQVLSMERTRTLPIAVYNFVSYAEIDWGAVMAAAVVIIAPAIVLTMFFQKYVIRGLTMGAEKG